MGQQVRIKHANNASLSELFNHNTTQGLFTFKEFFGQKPSAFYCRYHISTGEFYGHL